MEYLDSINTEKLSDRHKIPVTVITGFLGAGKTTLINKLLKKYNNKQFALVENEFGEVSIDSKLIQGVNASQMFELKEGCICCTITDEYEQILQELAERFPNVEHLLIETTGVADPAAVIQPFYSDEKLQELYHFNGTICILDIQNFEHLPEKEIRYKQLALADQILINKAENLSDEQKLEWLEIARKINPFANIGFSQLKQHDTEINLENISQKIRTAFDYVSPDASHAHIDTKLIELEQPILKEEFIRKFSYMMDVHKRSIYRAKGILYFKEEPFEYILQGIGGSYELVEGDIFNSVGKSIIVLIGKDLVNFYI